MKKRDNRFDAEQMDLFRQGKPVDNDWFQDWLKRQVGENPDMPAGTEVLLSLDSGDSPEAELNEQFDLYVQGLQRRAKGATEEALESMTEELIAAEAQLRNTLNDANVRNRLRAVRSLKRWRNGMRPSESACAVPRWGEFALLFVLPKKARETLPADLAQEFREVILPKMGPRLAPIWYWVQVARTAPWMWFTIGYTLLRAKIGLPI
ncbi:MAG TPA: hypothetical protein VGR79_04405 [Stellaceae bacterium]|nr:hypothetical protein [Stellaceae bacterium]